MRRKLLTLGVFASLTLALPGSAAAKSGANSKAAAGGAVLRNIVCHGLQTVPVTSDAEQALPFHIVASLNCGAEVAVLSDDEGYTARISTADGKNGYVARMYLSATPANSAKARPSEAVMDNGIARWHSGDSGSEQFFSNGSLVESLNANGITVQVSLDDTDWKLRATVAIANHGGQPLHFDPARFTLDELKPRLRALAHENPHELAKVMTHQVYWTNASATAPASLASAPATYKPAAFVESSPNYLAQDMAQTQAPVLTPRTLAPNEKTSGVVWFERDKNPQYLTLRIFVDDYIFEFPLSFAQH